MTTLANEERLIRAAERIATALEGIKAELAVARSYCAQADGTYYRFYDPLQRAVKTIDTEEEKEE